MRHSRTSRGLLFFGVALGAAACTDTSSSPLMAEREAAFNVDSVANIPLPPVIVIVDPNEPSDPCGGGSCGDPSDPDPGNGSGGGSFYPNEPGDGPGGSGPPPPPAVPDECDPNRDPECEVPLTVWDQVTIDHAFQHRLRRQFTDPEKERVCQYLESVFRAAINTNRVFRGAFTTPPNDPHTPEHYGAYNPGTERIHLEAFMLDRAAGGDAAMTRELANTALHEAAHLAGFNHTTPLMMGGHTLYAEHPFSALNPGANSCIVY